MFFADFHSVATAEENLDWNSEQYPAFSKRTVQKIGEKRAEKSAQGNSGLINWIFSFGLSE